jgi:putative ABC transport system permease protein
VLEYGLSYTDIKSIRSTIPGVGILVPSRIMHDYVWNISRRVDCDIVGTVPWYPEMRNHHVARGRFFADADMDASSSVCVLGADMAQVLFPLDSPLGRDVRVGGDYYRVIGVMEPRGKGVKSDETQAGAKAAAHEMFIPLETAKTRYGEVLIKQRSGSFEAERVQLHEVTVKVASRDQVLQVAEAVKAVLKHHHKKKDCDVVVPLELLARVSHVKYQLVAIFAICHSQVVDNQRSCLGNARCRDYKRTPRPNSFCNPPPHGYA